MTEFSLFSVFTFNLHCKLAKGARQLGRALFFNFYPPVVFGNDLSPRQDTEAQIPSPARLQGTAGNYLTPKFSIASSHLHAEMRKTVRISLLSILGTG